MNNKNIFGNGSKATLPGGKNLSDKIQENKTKNNMTNKSGGGTKGTSTTNNKAQEKSGQEKSKGQQTAQAMGTEAAKEALKKATGTIPWTRWIPKGIRDKIIDKFMDSGAGQAAVEKGLKQIRTKIIMIIVGAIASIFMSLLIFSALFAMVTAPVAWISDVGGGVGNFFKSFGSWFAGNGWCADLEACQANAEYKYYEKLDAAVAKYKGICDVNPELITATIFYGQMFSEEPLNLSAAGDEDEYGGQGHFNFIDVSEKTGKQYAKSQINKLLKVHLKGEGLDADDLDSAEDTEIVIDEDNPCSISSARYREYLIDTYIDWAYPSILDSGKLTKEEIADEILQMGGLAIGGTDGHTGEIVVGAGEAGEIPIEILSNCTNPLGTQNMTHTSCFKYYGVNNCTPHSGIDVASSLAEPELYSIADGEVITVVSSATHCQPDWKNGKACSVCAYASGNRVTVKHSVTVDGKTYIFYSEYMHLKRISVDLGQKVSKGDKIGIMGNTGCSTGKHLHFNMLNEAKQRYNPEELLSYLNLPLKVGCDEARRVCSGG